MRKNLRLHRRVNQRINGRSGDDGAYDRQQQSDEEPDGFLPLSTEINVQHNQNQDGQDA